MENPHPALGRRRNVDIVQSDAGLRDNLKRRAAFDDLAGDRFDAGQQPLRAAFLNGADQRLLPAVRRHDHTGLFLKKLNARRVDGGLDQYDGMHHVFPRLSNSVLRDIADGAGENRPDRIGPRLNAARRVDQLQILQIDAAGR